MYSRLCAGRRGAARAARRLARTRIYWGCWRHYLAPVGIYNSGSARIRMAPRLTPLLIVGAAALSLNIGTRAATTGRGFGPHKHEMAALDVQFNETDGNRTVMYGRHRLVGGIPTIWSATPAKGCSSKTNPKGLDCWSWPRKVVSQSYDSASKTFTQVQNWGSWSIAHVLTDSTLDMTVSVTNSWNESTDMHGVTLSLFGEEVGPAAQNAWDFGGCANTDKMGGGCKSVRDTSVGTCPGGWIKPQDSGSPRCSSSIPQIMVVDSDFGALVSTMPQNPPNLTFGFPWVGGGFRLEVFADVAAGQTVASTLSLRFAPPAASPAPSASNDRSATLLGLANDTLADWRAKVPNTVDWPDRGPIGGLFPSDYNGQNPKNPRGWTWMKDPKAPSITTPEGIKFFEQGALSWMNTSVQYCLQCKSFSFASRGPILELSRFAMPVVYSSDMGDGPAKGPGLCQGLTVWSLEGQEYPQDISYIGAPDMLSELAPEMDAVADRACSCQFHPAI